MAHRLSVLETGLLAAEPSAKQLALMRTAIVLGAGLAWGATAHAQPAFYGLDGLPGGNGAGMANALSGDGLTVVGSSTSDKGPEACVWQVGKGVTGLGDFDGGSHISAALAVSRDGSVVVGYGYTETGRTAFRWTAESGLTPLPAPAGFDKETEATTVSDDGKVAAGTAYDGKITIPVRWTADGVEVLSSPPDEDGALIKGASADGSVLVGYENMKAYIWRDSKATLLEAQPKTQGGFAIAISADGTTVVGYSYPENPYPIPTVWRSGKVEALPMLKRRDSAAALAVSENGSVIVGRDGEEAAMWTASKGVQSVAGLLKDLKVDATGWKLTTATGVSANGKVVVGIGTNPGGKLRVWIVDWTGETLPKPRPRRR